MASSLSPLLTAETELKVPSSVIIISFPVGSSARSIPWVNRESSARTLHYFTNMWNCRNRLGISLTKMWSKNVLQTNPNRQLLSVMMMFLLFLFWCSTGKKWTHFLLWNKTIKQLWCRSTSSTGFLSYKRLLICSLTWHFSFFLWYISKMSIPKSITVRATTTPERGNAQWKQRQMNFLQRSLTLYSTLILSLYSITVCQWPQTHWKLFGLNQSWGPAGQTRTARNHNHMWGGGSSALWGKKKRALMSSLTYTRILHCYHGTSPEGSMWPEGTAKAYTGNHTHTAWIIQLCAMKTWHMTTCCIYTRRAQARKAEALLRQKKKESTTVL